MIIIRLICTIVELTRELFSYKFTIYTYTSSQVIIVYHNVWVSYRYIWPYGWMKPFDHQRRFRFVYGYI